METPTLRRQMTPERLDRFTRAWLARDVDALRSYLAVDVVYSPLSGEVVTGLEAVARRFAELLDNDDASELRFEACSVSGSLGTCRWRLVGRTVEGGCFEIEGVDIYEFAGDLIRSKDVYQKA